MNVDNVEGGDYMYELVERAPEVAWLLFVVGGSSFFKGMVEWSPDESSKTRPSKDDIRSILDPKIVGWDDLHTDLLWEISRRPTPPNGSRLTPIEGSSCSIRWVANTLHP